MTERLDKLNTFLAEARAAVQGAEAGPIVLGNEAADLDSMVSAVLYGQLASARRAPGAPPAVPVVNCPRSDFVLRTEAVYLFAALGLDVDALLFLDEVDLDRLHGARRLQLTLVDHNVLSADQADYGDVVGAIIDHHADGGQYLQAEPRVIETTGSAATLVAEAMLRDKPDLIEAGTATLLLGTILLDTVNLDPAAERATAKDRAVAAKLAPVAGPDADGLFERLEAEKFNVSALGTGDLLRKDYKAWETPSGTYGISTVLTSLEDWAAKDPALVAGLDAFLRSRDLVCLLAMMAYTDADGGFHRDLAVYAPDPKLASGLTAMLEAHDLQLSELRPAGLADPGDAKLFSQGNIAISRKKLQPLLQRFFADRDAD
ncbi:MAG: DHH family phosphoesterase [Alphaproteobacteria bacterium]|nr:DHH family phosphoesterase [Alphaproteobacteria bacterium]